MDVDEYEEVLTCKLCNKTYDDPIRLPCNSSICSNHVEIDAKDGQFYCKLCNEFHLVPSLGFSKNVELKLLVKMRETHIPKESAIGGNNLRAQELCSQLDQLLEKSKHIAKDPQFYINDFFSNLKNTLDLDRETKIKAIDEKFHKMLDIINAEEKICLQNSLKKSSEELNNTIEIIQSELNEWNKSYADPTLNDQREWHDRKNDMEYSIRNLEYALNKFQAELLSNKDFKYESKKVDNENCLGELKILKIDLDEASLEKTIRFELKNFKSFVSNRLDRWYDKWCVINDIPWKFVFSIDDDFGDELDDDSEFFLFFSGYFIPDSSKEIFINKPFKAIIDCKLLTTNGDVSQRYRHTFIHDGTGDGNGNEMFSIQDILATKNKVYDKKTDSIKIDIHIKIINI